MSEPIYTVTTESLYARLPEAYRTYDAKNDYVLKKFISSMGDQAGYVESLLERFDTNTPDDPGPDKLFSDLAYPSTADPAWLDWIAQLMGVKFPPQATVPQKRAMLADPTAGFEAGTKQSLINIVKNYLMEPKTVDLTIIDQWHILIEIIDAQITGTTYDELRASYPTYQALDDAYLTYGDHGSSLYQAQRAILSVKPAGVIVDINAL